MTPDTLEDIKTACILCVIASGCFVAVAVPVAMTLAYGLPR
jgi:hypothetical protein